MFKIKSKSSKFLAALLALIMLVSIIPVGVLTAFATTVDSYTISLTDGTNVISTLNGVEVTIADKATGEKIKKENTVAGVATFTDFVEVGETYTVSVSAISGYEGVLQFEIVGEDPEQPDAITNTNVALTALERIVISGIVIDENDQPYANAKVAISGYVTGNTITDNTGKYAFEAFKGKNYTIVATANEAKYETATTAVSALANDYECSALKFEIKQYTITNIADSNGTIDATDTVDYGSNKSVTATANDGFVINTFVVDGVNKAEAEGQKNYTVSFNEIEDNHSVTVTFVRETYKITFTVGVNGNVTYNDGSEQEVTGGSVNVDKIFEASTDPSKPTIVTVAATPENGYRVSKVVVDGSESTFKENDYIYSKDFEINKNYTFEVVFSKNEYTVTLDTMKDGTAELSTFDGSSKTSIKVKHGESVFVNAEPNGGYELSEIKIGDTPVSFIETVNTYETTGTVIESDATVQVTFVEKVEFPDSSYKVELPDTAHTVNGVTYVADGETVTFTAQGDYKRVRINGELKYSDNSVSLTVSKNGDVEKIHSIEISSKDIAGWSKKKSLNITYDDLKPTISKIENSGVWKNSATTYTFTVNDTQSGIKEVKYSSTNDIGTSQTITPVEGKYSFDVSTQFGGKYYIWVIDNCGNTLATTADVCIDLTLPTITGFEFSTKDNNFIQDIINFFSFGTICSEKTYVTVVCNDKDTEGTVSSGLKEVTLYRGDKEFATKQVTGDSAVFELTENDFRYGGEISATVRDVAGNISKNTKPTDAGYTSNNIIIDSKTKPTATIVPDDAVYTDSEGKLWYNGNLALTITAKDANTGIKNVRVKINDDNIATDINGENIEADFSESCTKEKVFVINTSQSAKFKEGENIVEVVVTNNAGLVSEKIIQKVYYDETEPNISRFEITHEGNTPLAQVLNFLSFGTFFNNKVEITVTASDETDETDKTASSGVEKITLYADGEELETLKVIGNKATFTIPGEDITDETKLFDKVISAKATDFVGNTTVKEVEPNEVNSNIKNSGLMIETIDPTIIVDYNKDVAYKKVLETNEVLEWYKSDVEFKVTATDEDTGLRNVFISINDIELFNEDLYDTETHKKDYIVNTGDERVSRNEDGSYILKVIVTDNAGNVRELEPIKIFKDTAKPVITGFNFEPIDDVTDNEKTSAVEVTEYGFYFKEATKVIISAKDEAPSAGVKNITYYTVDKETGESEKFVDDVNADGEIEFTIKANFKGQIYAKATDNVLNTADDFVNPNSAIVEDADKHSKETHIEFATPETNYTDNTGIALYEKDVPVTITVTDTYSGINNIEWAVEADHDKGRNQNGKVTVNNDKTFVVEDSKNCDDASWEIIDKEVNLITKMQRTITVDNDSNEITIKVRMTDRAGNSVVNNVTDAEGWQYITISIDKTIPTIDVVYDNNKADEEYTDIFNADREATITITERNFRAEDIVFAISNTDKIIPLVDLKDAANWITTANAEDPDLTTHVAKIKYTADGDYTFDISYKDRAGNAAADFTQHKFTIDKTIPTVTVAYDNNSAMNGNYYKADRTATISIKEHNFDAKRVRVIGTATDSATGTAVATTFPAISGWKDSSNDVHTATISYTADSKYIFDIEFIDKAGNSITDFTAEEFYIDKTAPTLEISGVADKSANNGTVAPVITYTDTNFNGDAVVFSLTGSINGKVNYAGSLADIVNGQTYTYSNFEKVQKVDDIYTLIAKLTDMAGNETEKTITFSVNRFGSVYDLAEVEDIVGKYLQKEQDIVFIETNVDSLEREGINLKLTKNGTPTDLKEGSDYTIEVTGGNGQWSVYKYTVNKELFADDGRYSISVYSKDAAGNVNENIDESKKAEISFGIDKTKPVIVPINFESGVQYPVEMKTISVEIKDNLVLEGVKIYLNGQEIEYTVDGETYTFNVAESTNKQDVKIVAIDAAGNEYEVAVEEFLVNTNIFVRWYNNTSLFVGSIIGVVVLVLALAAFFLFGKKKKKDEEK